jgi:hypothetical protein
MDTYTIDATDSIDDLDEAPAEAPCTLLGILEPDEALAAAERMQRQYQSSSHSLFGRDGRRVEGRLRMEQLAYEDA